MASIETKYLGLTLKSPVIVASSPLTQNVVSLKKCEEAGAGAVVLKSLFEEDIEKHVNDEFASNEEYLNFSQAEDFYKQKTKQMLINNYTDLIKEAKKELSIPVIASICCKDKENWGEFAKAVIASGADAIELNYYPLVTDATIPGKKLDEEFEAFVKYARKNISCPLSIKIGGQYSALANKIRFIDNAGVDGTVLFNRSFRQDIDIENLKIVDGNSLTSGSEYTKSLKWVALMAGEVKMDLAGNTGIADGETVVKMLLAGAKAVEVCSAIMKNGTGVITEMNDFVSSWMDKHGYGSVSEYCGVLAQERNKEGFLWARSQFFRTAGGKA